MNTLPVSPPEAAQIGASCFSFASERPTVYFSNLEPFDCHGEDDRPAMLLRVARFARHGIPHRDLQAAFGISRTTVHRALDKLRDRGEAAFHEPRRGRGTSAITGETADAANRLLAEGMSGAAAARELGVSVATQPPAGLHRRRNARRRQAAARTGGCGDGNRHGVRRP